MGAAVIIGIPGLLLQDEVESAVRFGKSAYCLAETMLDHRTLQKDEFNARLARRLLNLCEAQGNVHKMWAVRCDDEPRASADLWRGTVEIAG